MRKGDREILNISKGQPIRVKKTVQNSSSLTPDSTRNTANSKENASVRVSERIKNRISNSDPSTQDEKLAPVLEPEPLPSTSDTYSSEAIVCQNPVNVVVNSQRTNRKRRKLSKKQKELARLRVREYRRNMTEEKKEQQKIKDKERYQKRKMMNIIKPVSEMTVKEKRLKRREWRINLRRYYQNKKRKLQSEKVNDSVNKIMSSQMKTARKNRRKKEAKIYRENLKLKAQNEKLLRQLKKCEKRAERQKQSYLATSFSPNTKINQMVRGENISPNIKKNLLFCEAFKQQIMQRKSKAAGDKKSEQMLNKILAGRILKKYRIQAIASDLVSYQMNSKYKVTTSLYYSRKKRKDTIDLTEKNKTRKFLERDDNSRMFPGKNDFITRHR